MKESKKFRKLISGECFVVGSPTIRQNKAVIEFISSHGLNVEMQGDTIEFSELLDKVRTDNLLENYIAILIKKNGTTWKPGCNDYILDRFSDLTEDDVIAIHAEFFDKKKAWMNGLVNMLQNWMFTKLLHILAPGLNQELKD